MKIAENLLEIAREDLRASKCLYDKGLYPQAVFYLQQSVEKASKSFGVLLGIINESEMKNTVGHNPMKIYKKVFGEQKIMAKNLNLMSRNISITDKKKMGELADFETYDKVLENSLDEIDFFCRRKEEFLIIQNKDINLVLSNIDEFESLELDITISDEELDEKLKEFKEALWAFIDCFRQFNPEEFEKMKEEFEKMKEEFEMLFDTSLIREIIEIFEEKAILEVLRDFLYSCCSLLYLSLIMTPHAVTTRYPVRGFNPLDIYTKELPLIQSFDKLTKIMGKTLSKMENLIRLTSDEGNTNGIQRKISS